MAKAIRVPEVPKEDTRDVQLTLTHKEAQTLFSVLGHVNGYDGSGGFRDEANAVYFELEKAGFKAEPKVKLSGYVSFNK